MKRIITLVLLVSLCALSAMAQSLTVSGTVKDAGGEPLIGVVVAELGSQNATVTDIDGNYYQWGRKDPFPSIADYCNYWPCQYANTLIGTPTYTPIVALRVHGQSAAKNVNNQVWGYRTKEDDSFNIDSSWHTIERNSIGAPSSSNSVFSGYAVEHPYVYILNSKYPDGGYYPWMTTNDHNKYLAQSCPVRCVKE